MKIFFQLLLNDQFGLSLILILIQPVYSSEINRFKTNELDIQAKLKTTLTSMPKELTRIVASYTRDLTNKEEFEFDNKEILEEFKQLSIPNKKGVFILLSFLISMNDVFIYDIQENLINSKVEANKAPLLTTKISNIVKQIRKIVLDQHNKRITSVTKKRLSKKPILKKIDQDSKEKIKVIAQFALDFLIYIQTFHPEVLNNLSVTENVPKTIGYKIKDFSN